MASVKQAQRQLEALIKAGANKIVLALEGPAGLGKSAVVKQAGKNTGLPVIDLRLAQMPDCGDMTGIPYQKDNKTWYAEPMWWPEVPSILFLDEPNRGSKEVRQAVFQLLTEHCVGTRKLPDGCFIVLAFNPSEGEVVYDVEPTDAAWNSRFVKLSITPDVEGWLEWATANGINEMVRRFITAQPQLIHAIKEGGSFPCPRTWEMLSTMLNMNVILPELQGDVVSAIVGTEAAASFIAFMDKAYRKPVSWKEVLTGHVIIDGNKVDVSKAIQNQRTDENTATATDIAVSLNAVNKLTEEHMRAIMIALNALSAEAKIGLLAKIGKGSNGNEKLKDLTKFDPNFTKLVAEMMKQAGAI